MTTRSNWFSPAARMAASRPGGQAEGLPTLIASSHFMRRPRDAAGGKGLGLVGKAQTTSRFIHTASRGKLKVGLGRTMHIPIRSHRIYLSGKAASAIVLRRLHASQLPPSTTFSSLIARLTPPAIKRALSSSGPQRLAPVPAKGPAPAPAPATPAGQRLGASEYTLHPASS